MDPRARVDVEAFFSKSFFFLGTLCISTAIQTTT